MKLYEIIRAIDEILDDEALEPDQRHALLDQVGLDLDNKLESLCRAVKNLEAEAEVYRDRAREWTAKARSLESRAEWLRSYLAHHIPAGEKWKRGDSSISYRKSQAVNVTNLEEVPNEYRRIEISVAKSDAIRELKAGIIVPGLELVESYNIQVK